MDVDPSYESSPRITENLPSANGLPLLMSVIPTVPAGFLTLPADPFTMLTIIP